MTAAVVGDDAIAMIEEEHHRRVPIVGRQAPAMAVVFAGKPFAAIVVCHRYWKNNLATVKALGIKKGGKFVNGIHFIAAGGPIGSMLALMSYFGTGRDQGSVFWGEDTQGKPAAELPRGVAGVRARISEQSRLPRSNRRPPGLM